MKKKKVLYLSEKKNYQRRKGIGICNKIDAQIRQFEKAGCEVVSRGPTGNNSIGIFTQSFNVLKWSAISNIEKFDVVYIRFDSANRDFVRLLRRYKKKNPNGKVILEIPTYPFRGVYIKIHNPLYYAQIQFYLLAASRYIDRIVLVASKIKRIYNKPVLPINNGVDYETIRERMPKQEDDNIHIICVASFAPWHGCDRLIEGLKSYISSEHDINVVLHLVGGGKELIHYKELVDVYGLEKNVIFHGVLFGEELDAVYDMCDLAVECFGLHRVNVKISSSLKSKEYGAKGLPILTSACLDLSNQNTKKYICKFPEGEDPIDIRKAVKFYQDLYRGNNKKQVSHEIRAVFQKYCSIEANFKNVIRYVMEDKPGSQ